jgi:hypothetical protein
LNKIDKKLTNRNYTAIEREHTHKIKDKLKNLSELDWAYAESNTIFANLCHLCHPANLTLELWQIASPTEWALCYWLATVDWNIGGSADVKWVVLIVLQVVFVNWILFTCSKDLTSLLSYLWFRPQLKKPPSKGCGCFVVLQLEEEVQGCPQSEDQVDRLQVAVGEVGRHLWTRKGWSVKLTTAIKLLTTIDH